MVWVCCGCFGFWWGIFVVVVLFDLVYMLFEIIVIRVDEYLVGLLFVYGGFV